MVFSSFHLCGFWSLPKLLITELLTGRSVLVRSAFKLSYLSPTRRVSFIEIPLFCWGWAGVIHIFKKIKQSALHRLSYGSCVGESCVCSSSAVHFQEMTHSQPWQLLMEPKTLFFCVKQQNQILTLGSKIRSSAYFSADF